MHVPLSVPSVQKTAGMSFTKLVGAPAHSPMAFSPNKKLSFDNLVSSVSVCINVLESIAEMIGLYLQTAFGVDTFDEDDDDNDDDESLHNVSRLSFGDGNAHNDVAYRMEGHASPVKHTHNFDDNDDISPFPKDDNVSDTTYGTILCI